MTFTTVGFRLIALVKQPRSKPCKASSSRRGIAVTPPFTATHESSFFSSRASREINSKRRTSTAVLRATAGGGESKDDFGEDDVAGGDREVQEEIAAELKYQTKLYQAQQFLEEKKDEFLVKGEASKEAMEVEAKMARDRAGLELGMRASEIDEQLAEMLEETAAARARNEKVQAELAELEEKLTGKVSGRFRKAPPRSPISALKQEAIDKEAADVDARMRSTLEDTQRKSAFTLILLLLTITDVSMAAEGAWDKFFAISAAIALVGYQAKNEYKNAENK